MIQDRTGNPHIFIPQPSHAWLSGQIGRAWGNGQFATGHPLPDVLLAAEQHDCGWASWEQQPRLDIGTGLPYDFMVMPTPDHISIWSSGPRMMATQSAYAALLVTLHNIRLAEIHDYSGDTHEEVEAMKRFIGDQKEYAGHLKARLKDSFGGSTFTDEELLEYNRKLVLGWDYISLLLCMGMETGQSETVPDLPVRYRDAAECKSFELQKTKEGTYTLMPWPFNTSSIRFECDAIEYMKKCETQEELNESHKQTDFHRFEFRFVNEGS